MHQHNKNTLIQNQSTFFGGEGGAAGLDVHPPPVGPAQRAPAGTSSMVGTGSQLGAELGFTEGWDDAESRSLGTERGY